MRFRETRGRWTLPRDVKAICLKASDRLRLEMVFVANQRIEILPGYLHASTVRVDGGPDVADRYIAERAVSGDVAVTADIPLFGTSNAASGMSAVTATSPETARSAI